MLSFFAIYCSYIAKIELLAAHCVIFGIDCCSWGGINCWSMGSKVKMILCIFGFFIVNDVFLFICLISRLATYCGAFLSCETIHFCALYLIS